MASVMKPNSPRLLGREISFWVGIVNALLAALLGMKWLDWSPENTALVLTAINAVAAVAIAIATRPFPVPLLSAALVAILTCAAGFGLNITNDQVGLWNTLLVAVWATVVQGKVSPEPSIDPLASSRTEVVR